MPNIHNAYVVAKNLRRSCDGLTADLSYSVVAPGVYHDKPCVVAVAPVSGGSEPHTVHIVWPTDGKIKPIPKKAIGVRYHCDCSDFRFTFHPHIDEIGEALFPFPLYIPNGRGQPRAIHMPGMCKHVMAAYEALIEAELVANSS